ncbi:MAG: hypothetical protein WKF68_10105, partial [Daejeonella sp.]
RSYISVGAMCRDGLLRFGLKAHFILCINISYSKWSSNPEKWRRSIHHFTDLHPAWIAPTE